MFIFQSELFQSDLYPDTAGDVPAVTAEEWIDGKKNCDPILVCLLYVKKEQTIIQGVFFRII